MATTVMIESDLDLLNELKVDLVHQITEIDDLETIKEMFVCLQQHASREPYVLSEDERQEVEQAIREMDAGLGFPHEVVDAEVQKWFQGKK